MTPARKAHGKHKGGPVDGVVGRGTLLAGRYRMLQPIASDLAGATAWHAKDQILDRAVRVAILSQGHVPQALDAARRAALVTDPRLVRVLDVGEHAGVAYMVTEPVKGPSLAQLVSRGPLPADQARAIIGEAASALETARRRGVHHLALRPSVLHLTPDDRVLLTGLAIDGALLGREQNDARSTTRADTVALVALLYAAMTGRWPGTVPDAVEADGPSVPQLPAAPSLEGLPVAPSELVAGVPNDLDTLCAVTLGGHDDGPHTPAELVLELEPWGNLRAVDLLAGSRGGSPTAVIAAIPPLPEAAPTAPVASPATVQRQSVRSAFAERPAAPAARPGTPPPAVPTRTTAFGAAAGAGGVAAGAAAAAARGATRSTSPGASVDPSATSVLPAAADPGATTVMPVAADPGVTSVFPTTAHPGATTVLPAASDPVSARPPVVPPVRKPSIPRPVAAGPPPTSPVPTTTGAIALAHQIPRVAREELSAAREAMVTKRFDPTKLVIGLVLLVVVVVLWAAFSTLTSPGGTPKAGAATPSARTSASASASSTPTTEPSATPSKSAAAAPVIASGQQLDPPPEGDNNEHPEAVPLAIDANPATFWHTRTYKASTFAGLKKGIGYAVNLTADATVTTVKLQVHGTGGNVEIRATDPSTPMQGTILAQGPLGPNTTFTLSKPTKTKHIVLWFTALPQTADGANRLELAEVGVS
ncbi:hypothetical protein [Pengzhenrongella sp.]|uniref:protein kinase family protein n=1 Tax=Pengzhenrongella sp. TaxID=2888820 RepID=UPI002F9424A0